MEQLNHLPNSLQILLSSPGVSPVFIGVKISFKTHFSIIKHALTVTSILENSTNYVHSLKIPCQKNIMLHYPLLLFSSHLTLILSGMSQDWTIPQHVFCQSPEYIYSLLQATKHIYSVMLFSFFFPFASIWLFTSSREFLTYLTFTPYFIKCYTFTVSP